MESLFVQVLQWLRLIVEAAAAFLIAIGLAYAFAELVAAHLWRQVASFRAIRQTCSRYLSATFQASPVPAEA